MSNSTLEMTQVSSEVVFIVDRSGSMSSYGKMQALNGAMEEALPFLRRRALLLPTLHPEVLVVAYGSQAAWVAGPAPLAGFRWPTLTVTPGELSELGAAIDLVTRRLTPNRRPPALILCSDGMPTDTVTPSFEEALARLDQHPVGRRTSRAAIAIGRDADHDTLRAFLAASGGVVLDAARPQQLVVQLQLAGESMLNEVSEIVW